MDRFTPATLLLLAQFTLPAVAGTLPEAYRDTPGPGDYPEADVLALRDVRTYTLHPDGRVDLRIETVEKVLTYHGMDQVGDPHFAFDSARQELEVIRSRTYTPEGGVVDTKANGINEITPFALEKAPDYTDIRQMVVTHVGLDVGAVVETQIEIRDRAPWRTFLEGAEVLQDDRPALVRQVVARVPAGTPLLHHLSNGTAALEVTHTGTQDVYTWTLEQVGIARNALLEPASHLFLPTLRFTTAPEWSAWSDAIGERVETALQDPDGEVAAAARGLVNGKEDLEARLEALHAFVVEGFVGVDWPLGDFDYAPRPAPRVLASSHGHALDRAVLLAGLLRAVGMEAEIFLFGRNPTHDPDLSALPCLARLDTPLVRTSTGDRTLWLDPTAKLEDRSARDFKGMEGLPLAPGAAELKPLSVPDSDNRLVIRLETTLNAEGGWTGSGDVALLGWYAPYYQVRGDRNRLDTFASQLVQSVLPGVATVEASVTALEPWTVRLHISFSAPPPEQAPPVAMMATGIPKGSLLLQSPFLHLSRRAVPLELPCAGEERVTIVWTLPPNTGVRYVPRPVSVQGDVGQATRTWSFEDGRLTVTSRTELKTRLVTPEDYPTYKAMHDQLAAPGTSRAIR